MRKDKSKLPSLSKSVLDDDLDVNDDIVAELSGKETKAKKTTSKKKHPVKKTTSTKTMGRGDKVPFPQVTKKIIGYPKELGVELKIASAKRNMPIIEIIIRAVSKELKFDIDKYCK